MNGTVVIKKLESDHTCPRAMRNKIVTSNWIARKYLHVFRIRSEFSCKELGKDLMQRFAFDATKWRLYHSKRKVIEMLGGTVEAHYAKLRSYMLELGKADREGRFELHVDVGVIFKALYIGFSGLRKGFKEGCRPVIGLDGAFLKIYLGGILLTAVGIDGHSQMYPIAWAVVEAENEVCWTWFIKILVEELTLGEGVGITIISDQQKGLENAVQSLLPFAEQRNCARKLEKEDGQAYADLMDKNPCRFCKAFLTPGNCSDAILNNVCECFNAYILEARSKHVLDMLDEMRTTLMERLYRNSVEMESGGINSTVCPKVRKKIEAMVYESRNCTTIPAVGGKLEVSHFEDKFVVTPSLRQCGCRKWDLTGIPCLHACAAIHFLKHNVDGYVHEYFSLSKYKLAYGYGLPALNGEKLWPQAEGYPVVPPPVKKMPGRPKEVRRRDPLEKDPARPNRMKKICVMTCRKCFQEGHNSRTCKNEPVEVQPKPKAKMGRPRKTPSIAESGTTAITGRGGRMGGCGGGRTGGCGGGRGAGDGSIPTQQSNNNNG
ncbi:uncharacterized protein LOC121754424 [Salvia splendens]|uniref:uncharacterized protein LOC121754424 n=1 Tax=Salvia splendens TaxID=180675 RepID=UPI001C25D093|nr:uncharacterized protein LOC121754424 [Salvia splendens]